MNQHSDIVIQKQRCQSCGGAGQPYRAHRQRTCPNTPPRPDPPPHRSAQDKLLDEMFDLRRAFRGLKQDLAQSSGNLDAPARSDWPHDPHVVIQELTIGDQLEHLHQRASRLALRGYLAAKLLRKRVRAILVDDAPAHPGFRSPMTETPRQVWTPPPAIALALERLRALTPRHAALIRPRPGDTPETARDRRLVTFWEEQLP